MEAEAVRQFGRFVDKRMIIMVHQRDPGLAQVFKKAGYDSILDPDDNIRSAKAEGMIIGLLVAKMYNKDYIGFICTTRTTSGSSTATTMSLERSTSTSRYLRPALAYRPSPTAT
jgi:mannosyl-3-phosphoglycerate synthase